MADIRLIDCTLRDGGYYNDWDFSSELIEDYLQAMAALKVDFVEIGFRSLKNQSFKGGCAFSTDSYLNSLNIPIELKNKIGVMVNGAELVNIKTQKNVLETLFDSAEKSPVTLVRIACHIREFEACLSAAKWLKEQGYLVAINIMQVADRTESEMITLAKQASSHSIDALYLADSMGSLYPEKIKAIIKTFRREWKGALGIHTHDNIGQAITNSLQAVKEGVTWVDCTVTGMGRGPGNAQTEYLLMALEPYRSSSGNPTKLFELIRNYFKPMQDHYGWGMNPYYYMAGQYGIHPSYIQVMLQDSRYSDEDIISVIEYLKVEGGKKFSLDILETARHFYLGAPQGNWSPKSVISGRDVLILGAGPSMIKYKDAIEVFIEKKNPYVIALNTQKNIRSDLIDVRAACHPIRLLADCHHHLKLPQPLITPASMLPEDIRKELQGKELLDFGISINHEEFKFADNYAQLPSSLVFAYALAIATSGHASKIFLVGFDGYSADDPRYKEMENLIKAYGLKNQALDLWAITPTRYKINTQSIYGLI